MTDDTLNDVMARRGRAYRDAAEAYRLLTGEVLPEEEAAEKLWYQRVRQRMVAARKRNDRSQAQIAHTMGTSQSEVSRLENSLGPGTRIGTLRAYLAAAGSSLESVLDVAAQGAPVERAPVRLTVEGRAFTGAEIPGILESLHAVNNLLRRSGMEREQRRHFILGFLHELDRARGGLAASGAGPDVAIDVPREAPGPTITVPIVQRTDTTLSEAEFRDAIAAPLKLADF